MPVPWSTETIPPEHFSDRKPGADPQLFKSCGVKVMQIRQCKEWANGEPEHDTLERAVEWAGWACSGDCAAVRSWTQQNPNNVTECIDILGQEAKFAFAPSAAAIGQVCDVRVDGEPTPCYTGYKYMLWNAKVREDEFLNDPSKLPKDKACSPCIKALVEYDLKMLQAYKNANYSVPEMTQVPAKPHVYVTTSATVTSIETVPTAIPPTRTVITFPATASSGYPWRIEVPAFPNDDAIDRISVYCGWKSAADVKAKGRNNAGSTTGSGAAQAVDMLGARGANAVVAVAAGVTAVLVAVMGMV
ncbi:hypothetical protein GGF32_006905 [Allomyces javanicus]|nr:hypothetical protein GGF32_006905 [Allomyces javanicus]